MSVTVTRHTTKSGSRTLLRYPIRRAAASEMLYGGVRITNLVIPAFKLHKLNSEDLPPPSLERERHDLGLEMQLPRDLHSYNNVNMSIQRQTGADEGAAQGNGGDVFHMGTFYAMQHHPERHHNSSLPYSMHDTNNVMALRLFPVNVGIRVRTEAIRLRTEDCLQRLKDAKLCAAQGMPLTFPLPSSTRAAHKAAAEAQGGTLYSGAIDPRKLHSTGGNGHTPTESAKNPDRFAHLGGGAHHPHPSELSLFTRPSDRARPLQEHFVGDSVHPSRRCASTAEQNQRWMPLQMIKPVGHNWSPALRSNGVRGPHMQLMQERIDQKGFGWKKKSRSLWQQDTATAGFRPHRRF